MKRKQQDSKHKNNNNSIASKKHRKNTDVPEVKKIASDNNKNHQFLPIDQQESELSHLFQASIDHLKNAYSIFQELTRKYNEELSSFATATISKNDNNVNNSINNINSNQAKQLAQLLQENLKQFSSAVESFNTNTLALQSSTDTLLKQFLEERSKTVIKQHLPESLIVMIYNFLCANDIIVGQFVCKRWSFALSKTQALSSVSIYQCEEGEDSLQAESQNFFCCDWSERKFWKYYSRFIHNSALIQSLHVQCNFSMSSLLRVASLIEKRVAFENNKTRRSSSAKFTNRVKKLSFLQSFNDYGIPGGSRAMLERINQCFPGLETLEFVSSGSFKMYDILSILPHLRNLKIGEIGFQLPKALRKQYSSDSEDEEMGLDDDDENESDDEDTYLPSSSFKTFMKAFHAIPLTQNIQRLEIQNSTYLSNLVTILQIFPSLQHLLITVSLDSIADEISEEMDFFVGKLDKVDMSNLKLLNIGFNMYRICPNVVRVFKSIIAAIGRATRLESLAFDIDKWNEELNEELLTAFINPMLNRDYISLRRLTMNEPAIFPNTFLKICELAKKHNCLTQLEIKVQQQHVLKNLQNCTSLTYLHVNSDQVNMGPSTAKYIEQLTLLEELHIDCSAKINFEKLPHLKRLYLSGRTVTTDVRSPSLLFLDLDDASITNIHVCCPNLHHFVASPTANTLSLTSCFSIAKLITSGALIECNLENCLILNFLDLTSSNSLSHLRIVNCPKIRVLGIAIDCIPKTPSQETFSFLDSISNSLLRLHLINSEISDSFLVNFIVKKLKKLEYVAFERVLFESDPAITKLLIQEKLPLLKSVKDLHIQSIPIGANSIPFALLGALFPNVTRLSLKYIKEISNESKNAMKTAISTWTRLNYLNLEQLKCLSSSEIQELVLSLEHKNLKTLRVLHKDVFLVFKLSNNVSKSLESLELTGYADESCKLTQLKHMSLRACTSSSNFDVEDIYAGAFPVLLNPDYIQSFPLLEELEVRLSALPSATVLQILDAIYEKAKNLKQVTCLWNPYDDPELIDTDIPSPHAIFKMHDQLSKRYPNLHVLLARKL